MRSTQVGHPRPFSARTSELARIAALVGEAAVGRGGALVVTGEPGIGKSALLGHGLKGDGGQVAWTAGAQFETDFPLAAVQRLCKPFLPLVAQLPTPQRHALEIAFGIRSGTAGDNLHTALAVLHLLASAAETGPLVCVVDDAQWLDEASARVLAFVARRLDAEPIAIFFAARAGVPELADLPQMRLGPLPEATARALLTSALWAPVDHPVQERILAEARGNPLALLELPRSLAPSDLAGGFAVPLIGPLTAAIEHGFLRRLRQLPQPSQLLVLTAAAEPLGDLQILRRAAQHLSIPFDALIPAERAQLLVVGPALHFRHPLVRSAIYQAAPDDERRLAHRALSAATDSVADPDRTVWHLAQATQAPDETVAAGLVDSAQRAQSRGGLAAAAAFLERAAVLTPHAHQRAERMAQAATAHLQAGAFDAAEKLTVTLDAGSGDGRTLARIDQLRGHLAAHQHRAGAAPMYLVTAARRMASFDVVGSQECCLDAMQALITTAHSVAEMEHGLASIRAVRSEASPADNGGHPVLDAVMAFFDPLGAQPDAVRKLLADQDLSPWERWPGLASLLATELWDASAWFRLAEHQLALTRALGHLALLPVGLSMLATARVHTGDPTGAEVLLAEEEAVSQLTGAAPLAYARLHFAAIHGVLGQDSDTIEQIRRLGEARGEGCLVDLAHWADALVYNAHGNYPRALAAAQKGSTWHRVGITGLVLPELVEAAMRCEQPDVARAAAAAFAARHTAAAQTPWGQGMHALVQALVLDDDEAEEQYREAVRLLAFPETFTTVRGRSHLLYGEWLRRRGRRSDAREHLLLALDVFTQAGAQGFGSRATRELQALGMPARTTTRTGGGTELSAQERQVARLAKTGRTSKEIAAELYVSPRTVDAHLRSIFRKLKITSRRELRDRTL